MPNLEEYRKYNPYTETILTAKSGALIVIDRYGPDDYGAWWTDSDHLYDDTFGCSCRGSLADVLHNIADDLKGE